MFLGFLFLDIIEVFKNFKAFENVSYNTYFTLSQSGLRGHSFNLYKPNFRLDIRKFSFSVRVINTWNALPYSVLQCNTVSTFKRHLDLCLKKTVDIYKLLSFFPLIPVKLS